MKGTAFGLFNLVSGLCLLLASVLAGWMWDRHGSASTFVAGGALALLALAATLLWRQRERAALAGLNPDRGGHRGDQAVRGRAPLPPPDAQGLGISLRAGQGQQYRAAGRGPTQRGRRQRHPHAARHHLHDAAPLPQLVPHPRAETGLRAQRDDTVVVMSGHAARKQDEALLAQTIQRHRRAARQDMAARQAA